MADLVGGRISRGLDQTVCTLRSLDLLIEEHDADKAFLPSLKIQSSGASKIGISWATAQQMEFCAALIIISYVTVRI